MIILTIDTDWAPDWVIADVFKKIKELSVKVTVFFTNPITIECPAHFEIGCHPDLHHVKMDEEASILKNLKNDFPEAVSVRTHKFYWHSDLPKILLKNNFNLDSSLILPYHPYLQPFKVGSLTRLPVWASDHLHLARKYSFKKFDLPNWSLPGLKIFCFHIAYLYQNTNNLSNFNMLDENFKFEDLKINKDYGIWHLFENLTELILKDSSGNYLSDLKNYIN